MSSMSDLYASQMTLDSVSVSDDDADVDEIGLDGLSFLFSVMVVVVVVVVVVGAAIVADVDAVLAAAVTSFFGS